MFFCLCALATVSRATPAEVVRQRLVDLFLLMDVMVVSNFVVVFALLLRLLK